MLVLFVNLIVSQILFTLLKWKKFIESTKYEENHIVGSIKKENRNHKWTMKEHLKSKK